MIVDVEFDLDSQMVFFGIETGADYFNCEVKAVKQNVVIECYEQGKSIETAIERDFVYLEVLDAQAMVCHDEPELTLTEENKRILNDILYKLMEIV